MLLTEMQYNVKLSEREQGNCDLIVGLRCKDD
jgi:hypothetical protein